MKHNIAPLGNATKSNNNTKVSLHPTLTFNSLFE